MSRIVIDDQTAMVLISALADARDGLARMGREALKWNTVSGKAFYQRAEMRIKVYDTERAILLCQLGTLSTLEDKVKAWWTVWKGKRLIRRMQRRLA